MASPITSSASPRPSELRGYFYMFLAFAFFLPVSLTVHYLSIHTPLTALNCYFIRSALELIIAFIAFLSLPPDARSVPRDYQIPLVLRGLSGALGMALFYQSLQYIPVGPATSILFLHPVLLLFFATCLLHEHLTRVHYISAF